MQSKNYISALSDWLACAVDETKPLVKSVFKKALKSLVCAPTCVPGFEYVQ